MSRNPRCILAVGLLLVGAMAGLGCDKKSKVVAPVSQNPSPSPVPVLERPTNLYGFMNAFGAAKIGLNVQGTLSQLVGGTVPATGRVIFAAGDSVVLEGTYDRAHSTIDLTAGDWELSGSMGNDVMLGRLARGSTFYGGWTARVQPEGDSILVVIADGKDAWHAHTRFVFSILKGACEGLLSGGFMIDPPGFQIVHVVGTLDDATHALWFEDAAGDTVAFGVLNPNGTVGGTYNLDSFPKGTWSGSTR